MAPPPLVDARTHSYAPFQHERIAWDDADIAEIAMIVEDLDARAVPFYRAFQDVGPDKLLMLDGVHPNETGQDLILRCLVRTLAAMTVH